MKVLHNDHIRDLFLVAATLHSMKLFGEQTPRYHEVVALHVRADGGGAVSTFRAYTGTKQKAKVPQEKSEEEPDFSIFMSSYGDRDKGNLKQLHWIQRSIAGKAPIKGWKDCLVQRCVDSLATDTTMADLITRSDVVISDFEEEIQHSFFKIVPCLREHAIWTRGEPGKGKTPLSRVLAVMCSRFHGGVGSYRTGSDGDYFRGYPFSTMVPAIIRSQRDLS